MELKANRFSERCFSSLLVTLEEGEGRGPDPLASRSLIRQNLRWEVSTRLEEPTDLAGWLPC